MFEEVKRVLRKDGTLWLNLGDSHASSGGERMGSSDGFVGRKEPRARRKFVPGSKVKDLVGIPWRVALRLQEMGWYLRSDIVWAKPNAMPESVTDRPGKAHEYVFLLTRSPRYYYDFEAVREPAKVGWRNSRFDTGDTAAVQRNVSKLERQRDEATRNLRDVWVVPAEAYNASFFAIMPDRLVVPMVRAGTSAYGVCQECGAPWKRVADVEKMVLDRSARTHSKGQTRASGSMVRPRTSTTVGWEATCDHEAGAVPATVLDPFAGTGTTLRVARRFLRRSIGIDLDTSYLTDRAITGFEYDEQQGITEEAWQQREEALV